MTLSRFNHQPKLTPERLKMFVAVENITAQTPLIEVSRSGTVRLWTAYDLTRTVGTYIAIDPDGSVRTVTRYISGIQHEIIVRPKDDVEGVHHTAEQGAVNTKHRRTKKVLKGA